MKNSKQEMFLVLNSNPQGGLPALVRLRDALYGLIIEQGGYSLLPGPIPKSQIEGCNPNYLLMENGVI